MLPVEWRAWVPESVEHPVAVMVFHSAGRGEREFRHPRWRRLAIELQLALVVVQLEADDGSAAPYHVPEQAAPTLLAVLNAAAVDTGVPEIEHLPIVWWGHSAGGMAGSTMLAQIPERTAGFVGFHGSVLPEVLGRKEGHETHIDALLSREFMDVPCLIQVGSNDANHIQKTSTQLHQRGRSRNAKWALSIDPESGHWDANAARKLAIPFVRGVVATRIGTDGLVPVDEGTGWLGQLNHHRDKDDEGKWVLVVDSATTKPTGGSKRDARRASWLIDEAFAAAWLAHHTP